MAEGFPSMVSYGRYVRCSIVWYGMLWCGICGSMVLYGMVWLALCGVSGRSSVSSFFSHSLAAQTFTDAKELMMSPITIYLDHHNQLQHCTAQHWRQKNPGHGYAPDTHLFLAKKFRMGAAQWKNASNTVLA